MVFQLSLSASWDHISESSRPVEKSCCLELNYFEVIAEQCWLLLCVLEFFLKTHCFEKSEKGAKSVKVTERINFWMRGLGDFKKSKNDPRSEVN